MSFNPYDSDNIKTMIDEMTCSICKKCKGYQYPTALAGSQRECQCEDYKEERYGIKRTIKRDDKKEKPDFVKATEELLIIPIGTMVRVKEGVENIPIGLKPDCLLEVVNYQKIDGHCTYICYWKSNDSTIMFDEKELELVLGKNEEIKVGDTVIVNSSYDGEWFNVGDKLEVLRVGVVDLLCSGTTVSKHMNDSWYICKNCVDLVKTKEAKDSIIEEIVDKDTELMGKLADAEVSSGGALRYNKGKPQFSHLSPDFIMEMMKSMTAANEKYGYLNYTKRMDVRTAADSLMRHFLKFQQGDDIDEELNTHHLALVAVNAMIMYQNLQDFGDEVDNRYSKEKEKVQGEKE